MRLPALALLGLALAGCASAPKQVQAPAPVGPAGALSAPVAATPAPAATAPRVSPYAPAQEDPDTRGHYVAGGLYRPGVSDTVPQYIPNVAAIPEPAVVDEPRSAIGNRSPYTVLGQQYHVLEDHTGFIETGLASYYGNKFHGRLTSNREVYDMYAFTAAHKSLPLPSFALVTNLDNGKSVVVRVNDRGPFHEGRVIDLSYAAAVKLGYRERGTARVEVRALRPGDELLLRRGGDVRMASAAPVAAPALAAATPAAPTTGMDRLLATMPATPAPAGAVPVAATAANAARAQRRVRAAGQAGARRLASAAQAPTVAPMMLAPGPLPPTSAPEPSAGSAPAHPAQPASAVVQAGPASTAPAPATDAGTAPQGPAAAGERFNMYQNGRAMSADEFDAWMAERQLRVATGQPTRLPPPVADASASEATLAPSMQAGAAAARTAHEGTPVPPAVAALPSAPAPSSARVTLQVASFADQGNAGQALARLQGANIDGARLQDADVNGRRIWRLRIGPVDLARAPELEARIAGLGMGTPQRVHE